MTKYKYLVQLECGAGSLAAGSVSPVVHVSCCVWLLCYLLPSSLLWARLSFHSGLALGVNQL